MSPVLPGSRSRAGWAALVAVVALAAGVVAALALTASADVDDAGRGRLVRYLNILVAAAFAIGGPHVLYPDPLARRMQLVNPSAGALLWHQASRWAPFVALASVPALAAALGGGAWTLAAEGALAVWGLGLYAMARVAGLGVCTRQWESGERGGAYRAVYGWAPPLRFAVPDPLVPGLQLTGEVFVVGAAVSIAGQAGAGLPAALGLVALAAGLVARRAGAFDRDFWATHGAWSDAFQHVAGPAEGRPALHYDGVYWAPRSMRPAVWAGLVSLDRRFPLGRVAVVGLVVVGLVFVVEAGEGARGAALAAWVLGINGAIALTATDAVVPPALARRLHSAAGWTLARALMNLRWLPPFALTLAALAWLRDDVDAGTAAAWIAADLAVAVLSALAVTLWSHTRSRRALA